MASISDNAAAVKAAAAAIDAAIRAKGATTAGGLANAAAAIASIQTGAAVSPLSVTDNGTYVAPTGQGYTPVTVAIDNQWPKPWRNDGKMHVWIYFGPGQYTYSYFQMSFVSAANFTVEWGDGSVDTIAASASATYRTLSHTYAAGGSYEVTIGGFDSVTIPANGFGQAGYARTGALQSVRQIELSPNTVISANFYTPNLQHLNMHGVGASPSGLGLDSCVSLKKIVGMGGNASAQYCSLLEEADISQATSLNAWAFTACNRLRSVSDMPLITSIPKGAFPNCVVEFGDMSGVSTVATQAFVTYGLQVRSMKFMQKTHTEVEAIDGFANLPNAGRQCVFHCSDGDFYRSENALLPVE